MQTETFEGLAISTELRRAVQRVGFETMTLIQAKANVDAEGIERYAHEVGLLLQEGYSSLDIAAALLKMASEGEGKDCTQRADSMFQNNRAGRRKTGPGTENRRN
jgi:hypothetical protein